MLLASLKTYIPIQNYVQYIIQKAYSELKLSNPKRFAASKSQDTKREFYKNYLKIHELIVTKTGSYLLFSQGKIAIRTKEDGVQKVPFHKVERIILTNTRISLSAYLIKQCSKHKIDIDFIDNDEPYALLTYHKNISHTLHLKQLQIATSNIGLEIAKNIHFAKAKNQLNLLKYYNIRKNDAHLKDIITQIEIYIKKVHTATSKEQLMGIEGSISSRYWEGFKLITNKPNFKRLHQNATDVINQALNYSYAILYNKIQSYLIKEGLNIYIPFLHAYNKKKPTLVFDVIEPFRQPVVDREIIAIINKHIQLNKNGNLFDERSKKTITQHIQSRLGALVRTKYGKMSYLQLIQTEINRLKHAVLEEKAHKFSIVKY